MKQILTILLSVSLLAACNSNDKKSTAESATVENHAYHDKITEGLVLNNGARWKADSTTVVNVGILQTIVSGAQKESLDNYTQKAKQLEDGLSKMISECTMKGADHDALHKWLEPLMEKTKDLKEASAVSKAADILHDIEKQVNLFPQYFEK